jgi:hypothetical protein
MATWLILTGLVIPSLIIVALDAYIQKRGQ